MKFLGSSIVVMAACVAVTACMPPVPAKVTKEDLLSSSGFKTITLNTPAKQQAFKALPAHELTRKTYKGKTVWVYPDRDICGCLYIGSQSAYNTYIKKATANMVSEAIKANYSDNPYTPTGSENMLDYDWADDPEAYGLYSDW